MKELEIGLMAVRQASLICSAVQAKLEDDAMQKGDRSPVTVADYASQALICKALADAFPDDPIMAEEDSSLLRSPESAAYLEQVEALLREPRDRVCAWIDFGGASEYSDRFWTLDPIDGTKGFLRKEQYAISLCLIVGGQLEAAVVACPNLAIEGGLGVAFTAARGQGAWGQALFDASAPEPIRVSAESDPAKTRFCESVEAAHSSQGHAAEVAKRLGITAEPVRLDSQAKYGVVARGDAEIYLRLPTRKDYQEKIWDHAGGCLVVQEAGGVVTDVAGQPLDFTHGRTLARNRGVIVSNGAMHDQILKTLSDIGTT